MFPECLLLSALLQPPRTEMDAFRLHHLVGDQVELEDHGGGLVEVVKAADQDESSTIHLQLQVFAVDYYIK